jgi:acetyl-CoA synthetase
VAQSRKLITVQAALRVLAHLASHPEGLEAAQVAVLLGKSLSTAYALLASLVAEGFAEREGNAYRLSQRALAPVAPSPSAEPGKLQHGLDELYLRTRERSYLALLHRDGKLRLSSRGRQGLPKPAGLEGDLSRGLHALALGKAVLAFMDEGQQALHLSHLERHRCYRPNWSPTCAAKSPPSPPP